MRRDHLVTIAEDLQYLATTWSGRVPIGEAEIRRGSCVLRRLLVEGALGHAWRAAGFAKEPTILAVNLEALLGDYSRAADDLPMAFAAGATYAGNRFAGYIMSKVLPTAKLPPGYEGMDPMRFPFRLSSYVRSASAFVEGRKVSRSEVIKYMANVRGGVHLGNRADASLVRELQKLERAMELRIVETNQGLGPFLRPDDDRLGGLFLELLSIGQAVASSPDSATLTAAILDKEAQ